jgi:hypothetical protein
VRDGHSGAFVTACPASVRADPSLPRLGCPQGLVPGSGGSEFEQGLTPVGSFPRLNPDSREDRVDCESYSVRRVGGRRRLWVEAAG